MATKVLGKYTVIKEGDQFRYSLKANNGEVLIISEYYSNEKGCRTGIETIKKNASKELIDITKDKHGKFHFKIVSKQGRVLGQSASYDTEAQAKKASESFLRFSQTETIDSEEIEVTSEIVDLKVEQKPKGKFKIETTGDEFYYILMANNKQIIARSQMYQNKKSCMQAMENFKDLVYTGEFRIFSDKNKNYQYKLYNAQKRLVMAGEVYTSRSAAISAIESIKRFAGMAVYE